MRYTIGDLRKHHKSDDIAGWWLDLPARHRYFWREALFAPGAGWLRWKIDTGMSGGYYEPPEPYAIAPPLRRLALRLRCVSQVRQRGVKRWWHEWDVMIDDERKRLYR